MFSPLALAPLGREHRQKFHLMLEDYPPAIMLFNAMSQFVFAGKPKSNTAKNLVKEIVNIRSAISFNFCSTLGSNKLIAA